MKKLMIAAASAVAMTFSTFAAEAQSWFNGGVAEGWPTAGEGLKGGAWDNDAAAKGEWDTDAVTVFATEEAPLTFTATDAKTVGDVTRNVEITSTIAFAPFEATKLPTVPSDAKAGAIVVSGDETTFYVLAKDADADPATNKWVDTEIAATADALTAVKILLSNDGKAKYTFGETAVTYDVAVMGEVSTANYMGDGKVSSLSATYTANTVTIDVAAIDNATAVAKIGEEVLTLPAEVQSNALVTVIYTANNGYLFKNGQNTYTTSVNATADGNLNTGVEDQELKEAPAEIDGTLFYTAQAAFDAAVADDTVTLRTAVAENVVYTGDKAFTLDMNGKAWNVAAGTTALKVDNASANITITGNGSIEVAAGLGYCVWARNGNVTIENGTYTTDGNDDYAIYAGGGKGTQESPYLASKITITGGTFVNKNTDSYIWNPTLKSLNLNVQNENTLASIKVSGGTYTAEPVDDSGISFVKEGYWAKKVGEVWQVVAKGGFMIYVAETATYYDTLAEAFANVEADGTITVTRDGTIPARINLAADKNVTLDMNGKTLAITETLYPIVWGNEGTATNGKLTITGAGTFQQDSEMADGWSPMILWAKKGTIEVLSGTFNVTKGKGQIGYVSTADGKILVKGGTFTICDNPDTGAKGDVFNVAQTHGLTKSDYIQCSGGNFSKDMAEGDDALGPTFVAEGYYSVPAAGDRWAVQDATGLAAAVGDHGYTTIADAVTAAAGEADVKLLAAGELAALAGEATIDLNSYNLTLSGATLDNDLTVKGAAGQLIATGTKAINADLDLSALDYATQLAGNTGVFVIAADCTVSLPVSQSVKDLAKTGMFAGSAEGAIVTTLDGTATYDGICWLKDGEAPWDGQGTEASPYLIATQDNIRSLQKWVADDKATAGVYFKQTVDVSMAGLAWDGIGKNLDGQVAGTDSRSRTPSEKAKFTGPTFAGTYDGDGKKITDVTFARTEYQGFFNMATNATFKNLTIAVVGHADGTAGCGSGIFAGCVHNTRFENCTAEGTMTDATHNVAGFAIKADYSTFVNCTNNATITTSGAKRAAGFVGFNYYGSQSALDGCPNTLVFENCVNNGDLTCAYAGTADYGCGGFIGGLVSGDITFTDCANNGEIRITGNDDNLTAGTFVGHVNCGIKATTIAATGCTGSATDLAVSVVDGTALSANGLAFATVAGDVATFCAAADGCKVMSDAAAYNFETDGSITFDETLASATVTTTGESPDSKRVLASGQGTAAALYKVQYKYYADVYVGGVKTTWAGLGPSPSFYDQGVKVDVSESGVNSVLVPGKTYYVSKLVFNKTGDYCDFTYDGTKLTKTGAGTLDVTITDNTILNYSVTTGTGDERCFGQIYLTEYVEYGITIAETENGTVTTSPDGTAAAGVEVTITATPDEGYEVDQITVTTASSAEVTVTDNKFTMPAEAVTVTATFKAASKPQPIPESQGTVVITGTGTDAVAEITPKTGVTQIDITPAVGYEGKYSIPCSVVKVTGVEANLLILKTTEGSYENILKFDTDGETVLLDGTKSVTIAGETIPVTPTATTDATTPISGGAVATATIPGLTYQLVRCTDLSVATPEFSPIGTPTVATSTSTTLTDSNKPDTKAFYKVQVTK